MDMMKYLEIPYAWCGRDWDGCDCYGLLVLYYREEFGIELWDPKSLQPGHWKDVAGADVLAPNTDKEWIKIDPEVEPIRLHDTVLIRLEVNKPPSHCGIIVSPYEFLHIQEAPGVHTSRLSLWKPLIAGYYRHRSLNG